MLRRLKLEMRHKQLYKDGNPSKPIIVICNPDGTAEYKDGAVLQPIWIDFTDDIEELDKLKLSWQAATTNATETTGNQFGSNYAKAVSLEVRFTGAAFQFIYDWLMKNPCQSLNSIDVRITDEDCFKAYRVFEIKLENTKYRPKDEPCIISMRLREKDDTIHSFQKTILEDDWQKWFNKEGDSIKSHPTFMYIVEKKPKFFLTILAVLAYIAGILSVGILVNTTDGKRWIRKMLGVCYFCPSPFIRTYIENICAKYGYTSNTIFDDLPINSYRDLCLFYPVEQYIQEFDDYVADRTTFLYENRTALPFAKFLNQLKAVFNAEWYVTPNNQLIFQPRAYFDALTPIHDFTSGGFELDELTYTFNGKKKPAYGNYQWQLDPADMCTNDTKWRYNTIVDYDGAANNPMLEGAVEKTFEFGMTAFNRDGTTEPYFESAIKTARWIAIAVVVVGLTEILAGTGGFTVFIAVALVSAGYLMTNGFMNNFYDDQELNGCIRLSNNQCNVPRLVLYDRNSPMNSAKVQAFENPPSNRKYATNNNDYYADHPTRDEPGFFGNEVRRIYNYPMFVDENFEGNLFDRFHEYDNPLNNLEINQDWEGHVPICCEMLDTFGVWENDFAKIGAVVVLEDRGGRLIKGRIEAIEPDYQNGIINLKGRVLK